MGYCQANPLHRKCDTSPRRDTQRLDRTSFRLAP
jgi:hypothetical protein